MNDWPVRFILDGAAWQRGYDLAIEQSDNCPPEKLANPFSPDRDECYGFEEGRRDAEKLRQLKAG